MPSSSSSPVINLPISNPQPYHTTFPLPESHVPISTTAFRSFTNHLFNSLRHSLSRLRPWSELINRTSFSKPDSLSEATLRIRKNYSYFRINYFIIISLILAFSLFSNPSSLLLLVSLLFSWLFLYLFRPSDRPLILFGRIFKDSEVLIALIVFSVCVMFLTSVGSILVSALTGGVAVVCVHGALRSPDDLFLDEGDINSTSFLSFFAGGRAPAAARV